MELVVLIIHLLVCVCLIGLVLLQRSEGGALGMGGGGGGSLMSGRGAADALAKMTSVAGGFFLVTSLGLTLLSGASTASAGGSVLDNIVPRSSVIAPAAPAPAPTPVETRPDPTESSAPQATDTRLASIMPGPAPAAAAPSTSGATRAGPLTASATQPTTARTTTPTTTRTTTPPPATARSGAVTVPASTAGAATVRPQPAATQRSTGATTPPPPAPLVLPNTSGSVTGIALTDDPTQQTESIEIGGGVEAVRRERAGPDQ